MLPKAFFSFLAVFFLLLSYYLIKPLRDSQYLEHFEPQLLPLVYLGTALISLAVTKVFNAFYERMDRYRLVVATFVVFMACKLAFTWLLKLDSKLVTIVFYYWASVYFLLAMAALWACINDIFTPAESERCFGYVAIGSTLGTVAGSLLSERIAVSPLRDYPAVLSAVSMALALGCVLVAARFGRPSRGAPPRRERSVGLMGDARTLWANRYVRSIAIMVFCLALYNTGVQFMSQKLLDRRLAEQQFERSFAAFDLGPDGFEFVYNLKALTSGRQKAIEAFLAGHGRPLGQAGFIRQAYEGYRHDLEARTRQMFSLINLCLGVAGVAVLAVASRWLFPRLGMGVAVCILPVFALAVLGAFCLPLDLITVEVLLVVSGTLNYSLNNAAKEILYTATSEETKFKHKPLIEGPGTRLGDVVGSLLKLLSLALAAWGERAFLLVCALAVLWWLRSIRYAGREFDRQVRPERSADG